MDHGLTEAGGVAPAGEEAAGPDRAAAGGSPPIYGVYLDQPRRAGTGPAELRGGRPGPRNENRPPVTGHPHRRSRRRSGPSSVLTLSGNRGAVTAAGKTFAASSAGDWRAYSRWAAGHARFCADEAGATGGQAAGVLARWREAAVKFDRDADEHRGLCSEPRHPYWLPRAEAEAEAEL